MPRKGNTFGSGIVPTKNPTTAPSPSIRAAQAFPEACTEGGRVSTRSARSIAITALIAKSIRYIDSTARTMVKELLLAVLRSVNMEATPRVYPKSNMANTQMAVPISMYGRRLPRRDVVVSASMPIMGCIMRPESGPARNTAAMEDFERPSESRYGDAYPISTDQNICTPRSPIVNVGMCNHLGPTIRAFPTNFWERDGVANGIGAKPVIGKRSSYGQEKGDKFFNVQSWGPSTGNLYNAQNEEEISDCIGLT